MSVAFARTQGEYLTAHIQEFGTKPNLKEFRQWQQQVDIAKQKLQAMTTSGADPEFCAQRDWTRNNVPHSVRAGWLLAIHQHVFDDTSESPYWDAMHRLSSKDNDCLHVLQFLAGYNTAQRRAEQRRQHPKDLMYATHLSSRPANDGWNRYRNGKPIPTVNEIANYIGNSRLNTLN